MKKLLRKKLLVLIINNFFYILFYILNKMLLFKEIYSNLYIFEISIKCKKKFFNFFYLTYHY